MLSLQKEEKENMKKVLTVALALAMTVSLTACSGGDGSSSAESGSSVSSAVSDAGSSVDASSADGSSEGVADGETLNFQFCSKGLSNTWYQVAIQGAEDRVKEINDEAGYEMIKLSCVGPDSQSDVAVQVQQLNDAVNAGADGIIVAPLDPSAVVAGLQSAADAGIPVLAFDNVIPDAPEGSVAATVATDSYAASAIAGEHLYEKIADQLGKEQVRIGVVSWSSVSVSHVNRAEGLIDKIVELADADGYTAAVTGHETFVTECDSTESEENADIIIETRVPAQCTIELAATEASALLNKSDTIALYCNTQDACEAALTANDTLNVLGDGEGKILFVGFDAGSVQQSAVQSGVEFGAVNQNIAALGASAIDTLLAAVNGEEVSDVSPEALWWDAENYDTEEVQTAFY